MDILREVTKGSIILIESSFYDYSGGLTLPETANITFQYSKNSVSITESIDLIVNNTTRIYSGNWDTSNCNPGVVYWCIKSLGIAKEGEIRITANKANI